MEPRKFLQIRVQGKGGLTLIGHGAAERRGSNTWRWVADVQSAGMDCTEHGYKMLSL